jgi:hypothetical protein
MKYELADFISWGFQGLVSGCVLYGVGQLTQLRKSIEHLNEKLATVIEKTGWHEKELDRHTRRLDRLEREKK